MAIQLTKDESHIAKRAQRFESTLTAVNARIVFLAGLVGAQLDADGAVQHIFDRNNPAFRQAAMVQLEGHGGHAGRMTQRAWQELRGLMVLRCDMVTQALDELGLGLTHQITSQVESGLERKGIKRGTDGFDLHRRMDQLVKSRRADAGQGGVRL